MPARSTSPNSCSTGPALWEFFRKSAVLQGKRPWRTGKRWPKYRYFNKLKTTPTPNKNGSYGIKGGFVCHKSRNSYGVKVGLCTTFSVEIPLFQGISTPYDPPFYGIFWEHIFLLIWGVGVVRIILNTAFLALRLWVVLYLLSVF